MRARLVILGSVMVAAVNAQADIKALELHLTPRTPEQMAAFYEARGFPATMIEVLERQCFITVRIRNNSDDVIWLELANWRFESGGRPLPRLHRQEWKARWAAMNIPLASQSTFRWTLLPETLDFQPDEEEGGNIILPRVTEPIRLRAEFASGADKRGPVIRFAYDELRCAEDAK